MAATFPFASDSLTQLLVYLASLVYFMLSFSSQPVVFGRFVIVSLAFQLDCSGYTMQGWLDFIHVLLALCSMYLLKCCSSVYSTEYIWVYVLTQFDDLLHISIDTRLQL